MQVAATHVASHISVKQEEILVIKRTDLFPVCAWHGLKAVEFADYIDLIQDKKCFIPRNLAELDPTYKQVIPYLVFEYDKQYFLMQRQSTSSEQRLASKYSLGIGGHLRKEDIEGASIFEWAQREFEEEVSYEGNLTIIPLGILNDDSNEVGKVHVGFVLLLKGDSSDISIKSELKSGVLVSLNECRARYDQLESWSQMVVDFLQLNKK